MPTRLPIIKRDGKICIQDYYVRHGREIALEYYYCARYERNNMSGEREGILSRTAEYVPGEGNSL